MGKRIRELTSPMHLTENIAAVAGSVRKQPSM